MIDPQNTVATLAASGDRSAFEALYRAYFEPIYRYCYWQTNRSADAEDLTQDIFIEAAKSIRNFKGDASFKNWLYVIAKRKIAVWIRRKYLLPTTPLLETLADNSSWIDEENVEFKQKQVGVLLKYLSDQEGKVLRFRYLLNYTVKETARAVKISETNVKVVTYRGIKKLRQRFSGDS